MRVLGYVEANPVAAALCAAPQDWAWSSYQATLDDGDRRVPDTDRLRQHIAPNGNLREIYAEIVNAALRASS